MYALESTVQNSFSIVSVQLPRVVRQHHSYSYHRPEILVNGNFRRHNTTSPYVVRVLWGTKHSEIGGIRAWLN